MPSGSHRTSGGSHRSGGSRSSSRSFSGGSSSFSRRTSSSSRSYSGSSRSYGGSYSSPSYHSDGGWYPRPRRPFRLHFGTRVYVFGGKLGLFIPFVLILAFALVVCSNFVKADKAYLNTIKVDYVYYHQMIESAENDNGYLKDAVIKDKFYNEEFGKWYYLYEVQKDAGGYLEGETYCIYTDAEINFIHSGDKIKVATNSKIVTNITDSVPIDFKNYNYKDDGEYIVVEEELKSTIAVYVVFWIAEIALVGGMILYMVKTKKREDEEKKVEENRAQEKHELETQAMRKDLDWRCEYCANLNSASKSKCDNCGAGKR